MIYARVGRRAREAPRGGRTSTEFLGFEGSSLAGAVLARTLWLQGHPAQAAGRARRTVRDAEAMDHPLTLCIALIWAISVFLWTGDLPSAEQHVNRLVFCAEAHSLAPYLLVGRGFEGELALRRGDPEEGVARLRASLGALRAAPCELLTTSFNIALAQGLATIGRIAEGAALTDETIRQVEANGDACYLPELLRVKGGLLLAASPPREEDAEACLARSLALSREQGARAWELRAGADLAKLLAARGRGDSAPALLRPILERFAEGSDTADPKAAERLLAALSHSDPRRSGNRDVGRQAARPRRPKRAGTTAKP